MVKENSLYFSHFGHVAQSPKLPAIANNLLAGSRRPFFGLPWWTLSQQPKNCSPIVRLYDTFLSSDLWVYLLHINRFPLGDVWNSTERREWSFHRESLIKKRLVHDPDFFWICKQMDSDVHSLWTKIQWWKKHITLLILLVVPPCLLVKSPIGPSWFWPCLGLPKA